MNFNLSEEQQLLQDSVSRFVQDNYDLDRRNAIIAQRHGFSREHWKSFAELGWLTLPFDEALGGFGGDQVDTMVVMEQFGRGLVVEPYLATVVLAGGVLKRAPASARRDTLTSGIMDGSLQASLAWMEAQARYDAHDVATTARGDEDGFVLHGRKSLVQNGQTADWLIVSARTSGSQTDPEGITLFAVAADADGVTIEGYPTVDGLRAAEVTLADVRVGKDSVLGPVDGGYALLSDALDDGLLAVCAEAVGGLDVLVKDTVEYTQQREQFGHPLSDFQSLRHRMVEMFMELEQCRSMLYRATMGAASGGPDTRTDLHGLKHLIGRAGQFIAENAVQLHGGMGVTEELRVGHYFKRQLVIDSQFGNADHHLERFSAIAA